MMHITMNPHQDLPRSLHGAICRIIESHGKLRKDMEALNSQLEFSARERLILQSRLINSRHRVENLDREVKQLKLRLSQRQPSIIQQAQGLETHDEQPTIYEFLRNSEPGLERASSPIQPPRAISQKQLELLSPIAIRGRPSSLLEPRRMTDSALGDAVKRSVCRSRSSSSPALSQESKATAFLRSASWSDVPTTLVDYVPEDYQRSPQPCHDAPVVVHAPAPTAPEHHSEVLPRISMTDLNSVNHSQTRIPSPTYRPNNSAVRRRDRSDSGLSTVCKHPPSGQPSSQLSAPRSHVSGDGDSGPSEQPTKKNATAAAAAKAALSTVKSRD